MREEMELRETKKGAHKLPGETYKVAAKNIPTPLQLPHIIITHILYKLEPTVPNYVYLRDNYGTKYFGKNSRSPKIRIVDFIWTTKAGTREYQHQVEAWWERDGQCWTGMKAVSEQK